MSSSLAQSAIAFLIDLAERGEVDPWDVKVIDVIDRFLSSLREQAIPQQVGMRSQYEASLSESGQAFLYASMLVLLKADTLVRAAEMEAEEELLDPEELVEDGTYDSAPLPRNLERHLRRRAVAAPPQKRQVTLNELIEQLEMIATVMEQPTTRRRSRRNAPQPKRQAVRAINQLAHQENLSEIAAALETFLNDYWDQLDDLLSWIDFEQLLHLWPKFRPEVLTEAASHAPDPTKHERVGVFWGLLFLSAQSKVELSQEQFYQDLKVRNLGKLPPEALAELPSYILPD